MVHSPNCGYEYTDICVCGASRPQSAAQAEISRLKSALDHQRHETGKRQSQVDRLTAEVSRWKDIADATEALKVSYAEQLATANHDRDVANTEVGRLTFDIRKKDIQIEMHSGMAEDAREQRDTAHNAAIEAAAELAANRIGQSLANEIRALNRPAGDAVAPASPDMGIPISHPTAATFPICPAATKNHAVVVCGICDIEGCHHIRERDAKPMAMPEPASSAPAVKVKPLGWIRRLDGNHHTRFSEYEVHRKGMFWVVTRGADGGGSYLCHTLTLDAAKARAQSDYARRILDDLKGDAS